VRSGVNKEELNVAVYVRESRDENGENYETIKTQERLLLDFIREKKLGRLYKVYVDDNVSGSVFDREGINRLKSDVSEGKIDILLIKDLSRLGRNNAKTLLFLDYLEENGVRVITFDGKYDSEKDNETVGIESWFNERYIRDISKKIRASLHYKIKSGEYVGKPPYGYKKSLREKNRLIVDEEEAITVKEIYELYEKGYGYKSICAYLNDKGCKAPSGFGKAWNPASIRRILTNRVYTGDTVQGVSEKISFKSKKTRRLPEDRWVITENTHEPIISKEQFDKIQKLIKEKKLHSSPHKGRLHIFKDMIFCGKCGSILYARSRKNRPMAYVCSNYVKNGLSSCTSHHVREDELKEIIIHELSYILRDADIQKYILQISEKDLYREKVNSEAAFLRNSIEKLERQQESLYFDKLNNRISEELFERVFNKLETQLSYMKNVLKNCGRDEEGQIITETELMKMADSLSTDNLTREIVNEMVEKIIIYEKTDFVENSPEGSSEILSGAVEVYFKF